jgi:hypothetical protein
VTTALIVGGGTHVRADVARALALFKPDLTIAINDMGALWRHRLDHWVTLHPLKMPRWLMMRRLRGLDMSFQLWTDKHEMKVPPEQKRAKSFLPYDFKFKMFEDYRSSGLSGLYAVKVALHLNATRIVLAGVPMDQSGHVLGRKGHWISAHRLPAWRLKADAMRPCVRSMSGWTCELLGVPTLEWINGGTDRPACPDHRRRLQCVP